ncbi:MAG: type II toxin-antitoxin system VapC family toxin [Candidatus Zixiibacteriota bacterium]
MKERIYIDTSVFGGCFDEEFSEHTLPLFKKIQEGSFSILFSSLTEAELEKAPNHVKDFVRSISNEFIEYLEVTEDAIELANEYINENIVGKTSYADCLHIAIATINRADFLISWNFKHIVNIQRIRGYNSINIKNGYKLLEIRSPREFENYAD